MGSLAYQTAVGGELLEAVGAAYGSGIKAGKIVGDEWLGFKKKSLNSPLSLVKANFYYSILCLIKIISKMNKK